MAKEGKDTKATTTDNIRYIQVQDPSSTGWSSMYKAVRESDEAKVEDYKDDIDTLLTFTGLYSAVLSAFLLVTYQSLQEDKQDVIVGLLERIATQNYISSGIFINSTTTLTPPPPFVPPLWAIRVNVLWFASLLLSLVVASIGITVKGWLREFLAMDYSSPQERLRARNYRQPEIDRWKVFEIAAILPVILQISLGLFFFGLCIFTAAIHESVRDITVPIVVAWLFFFLLTAFAPLFFPRCPFKITFLKTTLRTGRLYILPSVKRGFLSIPRALPVVPRIGTGVATSVRTLCAEVRGWLDSSLPILRRVKNLLRSIVANEVQSTANFASASSEEKYTVKLEMDDYRILLSVDSILADDNHLPAMFDVLQQQTPDKTVDFMKYVVESRTGKAWKDATSVLDLRALSKQAWTTLVDVTSKLFSIPNAITPPWAADAVMLLLSQSRHTPSDGLAKSVKTALEIAFQPARLQTSWQKEMELLRPQLGYPEILLSLDTVLSDDTLLPSIFYLLGQRKPDDIVKFMLQIIKRRTKTPVLPLEKLARIQDLSELSSETWTTLVGVLADLLSHISCPRHADGVQVPIWVTDTTILLLSKHNSTIGKDALRTFIASKGWGGGGWDAVTYHPPSEILLSVFPTPNAGNDSLLPMTLECFPQEHPGLLMDFISQLTRQLTPSAVSDSTWITLVEYVSNLYLDNIIPPFEDDSPQMAVDAIAFLLSRTEFRSSDIARRALRESLLSTRSRAYTDEGDTALRIDSRQEDIGRLLEADSLLKDDTPLPNILAIVRRRSSPDDFIRSALRIIQTRTGTQPLELNRILDLRSLSYEAWTALVGALTDHLIFSPMPPIEHGTPSWTIDAIILLLSRSQYPHPESSKQAFHTIFASEDASSGRQALECVLSRLPLTASELLLYVDSLISDDAALHNILRYLRQCGPEDVVEFAIQIIKRRTGNTLPAGNLTFVPNIRNLDKMVYTDLLDAVSATLIIHARAHPATAPIPQWMLDASVLLVSMSSHDPLDTCVQALREAIWFDLNTKGTVIADHLYRCFTATPDADLCVLARLYDKLLRIDGLELGGPESSGRVVDALFRLLRRLLEHCCSRGEELAVGNYQALQMVLESTDYLDYEVDVKQILAMFFLHRHHVHHCIPLFAAMHPIHRLSSECEHLFYSLFLVGSPCPYDARETIELARVEPPVNVIRMVNEYHQGHWSLDGSPLERLDLVRLCRLFLRAYHLYHHTGRRVDFPSEAWPGVWNALALGIQNYHRLKMWERNPADSVGNLLACDSELARECLHTVGLLKESAKFPQNLMDALRLFVGFAETDTITVKAQ